MRTKKFSSPQELYTDLSPEHKEIVDTLRDHFTNIADCTDILQRNCLVWKLPNGTWWYLNTYNKPSPVLGCSHVTKLLEEHPLLEAMFDEKKKVVGKVVLHSIDDIACKGIPDILRVMAARKNL